MFSQRHQEDTFYRKTLALSCLLMLWVMICFSYYNLIRRLISTTFTLKSVPFPLAPASKGEYYASFFKTEFANSIIPVPSVSRCEVYALFVRQDVGNCLLEVAKSAIVPAGLEMLR
jgi:hypothetical protein